MTDHSIESSPQLYARAGGAFYLIIIALGVFGQAFVRDRIVVAGDAAATASNITSAESLWRFGIAAEYLAIICTVALAMIYYFLLRPVSKEINLLATLFRMVAVVVQAVAVLNLVAALFPLGDAAYLRSFTPEQLHAMTSLAIRSHAYGYGVALLFTGCTFLFHGYLIFKSGYLPKTLGVLIEVAGLGYLANSFALILYPTVAGLVFLAIILPVFVGEMSLSLWLLVKGVNVVKWNDRLGAVTIDAPLMRAHSGAE